MHRPLERLAFAISSESTLGSYRSWRTTAALPYRKLSFQRQSPGVPGAGDAATRAREQMGQGRHPAQLQVTAMESGLSRIHELPVC
jgi:hypothetical protein